MWRRWLSVSLLVLTMLILSGSIAFADTPTNASSSTVTMQGQASVIQNQQGGQLRLKISSLDDTRWLLEVALNPVRVENDNSGNQFLAVNGYFTLGISQKPVSSGNITGQLNSNGSGNVTGQLNSNGSGNINLIDPNTSTSLNMLFSIQSSGSMTSMVQGQWPLQASDANQTPSTNHSFWFLSRTSALTAYILLFINICLGLGLRSKYLNRISERWRTLDLHQFTALLSVALIGLHIFALLGDSYFSFSVKDLLLPMSSSYRPGFISFGIIGFYLILAITFSCYIRRFIGYKAWRILHYASFVLFFIILYHGIKSGTDTQATWIQWLYISTGTLAVSLFLWRFLGPRASSIPKRSALIPEKYNCKY